MREASKKKPEPDTYVFVDVSNIRSACLKTLGMKVNFWLCAQNWLFCAPVLLERKLIAILVLRSFEAPE